MRGRRWSSLGRRRGVLETMNRRRQCGDARFQLRSNAGGRPTRVVSAQNRALDRWRLHDIGRHVSWAKIRAARLSAEFSLDVDACIV